MENKALIQALGALLRSSTTLSPKERLELVCQLPQGSDILPALYRTHLLHESPERRGPMPQSTHQFLEEKGVKVHKMGTFTPERKKDIEFEPLDVVVLQHVSNPTFGILALNGVDPNQSHNAFDLILNDSELTTIQIPCFCCFSGRDNLLEQLKSLPYLKFGILNLFVKDPLSGHLMSKEIANRLGLIDSEELRKESSDYLEPFRKILKPIMAPENDHYMVKYLNDVEMGDSEAKE